MQEGPLPRSVFCQELGKLSNLLFSYPTEKILDVCLFCIMKVIESIQAVLSRGSDKAQCRVGQLQEANGGKRDTREHRGVENM